MTPKFRSSDFRHRLQLSNVFCRRALPRQLADTDAMVTTFYGRLRCTVLNISSVGAKLRLVDAPRVGAAALIEWGGRHAVGRVIWTSRGECGVRFDAPLPWLQTREAGQGISPNRAANVRRFGKFIP